MIHVIMNLEGKALFMKYYKVNICYVKLNVTYIDYQCKQLKNSLTVFACYARSFLQNETFLKKMLKLINI